MILRARQFRFEFPRPALVMGIVNVTPDSFSDGGQFLAAEAAVEHGLELVREGAEILDIGGESSRPHAEPIGEDLEKERVLPVIARLNELTRVPISIDTVKPGVARAALRAGASIINDIGANRRDEEMWRLAAETGAGYVCMHMQGDPKTMQSNPVYTDVVQEVREFFVERMKRIQQCGVSVEQMIYDPGIGFGKTLEHNLQLLGNLRSFSQLRRPILIGASRKSFMGKLLGLELAERLPAALACASLAIQAGVQLIRTHDVAATVKAVRMTEAVLEKKT